LPLPGSTPLYTYPNPPCPSTFADANPPVAAASSSYEKELLENPSGGMPGDVADDGICPAPCEPLMSPLAGEYGACQPPPWSIIAVLFFHLGMLFA